MLIPNNQSVKERISIFLTYLGMGQRKFEKECGLSNGYVNNIRQSITPKKLQQISLRFPELNPGWLMTGEGEMLRSNISQTSHGPNSPNIAGDNNYVGESELLSKALDEIARQRELVETAQAQVSELINKYDRCVQALIELQKHESRN